MSNPINDGGPAFPRGKDCFGAVQDGMTMRDYFAGQALAGMLADSTCTASSAKLAAASYEVADAMLAAREAKP